MRFERLELVRFGPHRDLKLEPGPIALVLGPNEVGKTSLVEALEAALFGFRPAQRAAHPLWRWDESSENLELRADLRLDSGELLGIERVLQASGKSRRVDRSEDREAPFEGSRGGNAALRELGDRSRDLFRGVYSLGLEDLGELDERLLERIDFLLLPESEGGEIRPVHEVRRELREEAGRLWRDDRRGKSRDRQLQERIAGLRVRLREARDRERALRNDDLRLAICRRRSADARAEVAALRREAAEAQGLGELDAWRRRRDELAGLPRFELEAPGGPAELRVRLERIRERLGAPRARLERPALSPEPVEAALLERADEIEALRLRERELQALEQRADEREGRLDAGLAELSARLERLTDRAVGERDLERLASLRLDALAAAAQAWARELRAQKERAGRLPAGLWGLLLAAGLASYAVSFATEGGARTGLQLGALLALVAAALLRAGGLPARFVRLRAGGVPESVRARLEGLPIAAELLADPASLALLRERLEPLPGRLAGLRGEEQHLADERGEIDELRRAWPRLVGELGLELGGPPITVQAALDGHLRSARERREALRVDGGERAAVRAELAQLEPEERELTEQLQTLERALRQALPGFADADRAWLELDRVEGERHELERERRRLLSRDGFTELERRFEELRAGPSDELPWLEEVAARRQQHIQGLEAEARQLDGELGRLEERLAADPGHLVAALAEELDAAEEQRREGRRERDRLALLELLIADAELRHRRAHEPDVLRRAGEYLGQVTGGRYTALTYEELEGGGRRLRALGREGVEPRAVEPPLSRGTRDQVHLCLRLALVDHLDAGRERLPLLFDELLVRWDAARRAELYSLLERIAAHRQVLLLTCHPNLALEAAEALGVEVFGLEFRPAHPPSALAEGGPGDRSF